MNETRRDRLYALLPAVYRSRDAEEHQQLRDLLRVIAEQVNVVEDDIAQLYENWFIETCDDWVVPYIGDLLGYQPVSDPAVPGGRGEEEQRRNRVLVPRRELANFIRHQRRRGTLALLEVLAADSAGFSSRAVEFFTQLVWAQPLNHQRPQRGRFADLREGEALDLLGGPFNSVAHSADVRRPVAAISPGRYNVPSAGSFIWRLRTFPITHATGYFDQSGSSFYTFSQLANDAPIFTNPQRESDPTTIAGELNVPAPIRRRALATRRDDYYGVGKSFAIWKDHPGNLVPAEEIVAADLSDWRYRAKKGQVAVDPVLGRILFPDEEPPKKGIWVSYYYGFTHAIGGGEYDRPVRQADGAVLVRVGAREPFKKITHALAHVKGARRAVIEIADSETYTESLDLDVGAGNYLQLRAANGCRPVLSFVDWKASLGEALSITLHSRSRFVLDGVLVVGRPVQLHAADAGSGSVRVAFRHCTLVPGWEIDRDCRPQKPGFPSIEMEGLRGRVTIDSCVIGGLKVDAPLQSEPLAIDVSDTIIDATSDELDAVAASRGAWAPATLSTTRCTVVGATRVQLIGLAENSIFTADVSVVRRQEGCVRYCWVPPGSRTPRRYHCQPDLALDALRERLGRKLGTDEADLVIERVRPRFDSLRYGSPEYARLAEDCAEEIVRGADDESEMGAFHDAFLPQRRDNLRRRLDDYTPAGMETGIFNAD